MARQDDQILPALDIVFFFFFFRGAGNQYVLRMHQLQDSKVKHKIQVLDVAILVTEGALYSVRFDNHKTCTKASLIGIGRE